MPIKTIARPRVSTCRENLGIRAPFDWDPPAFPPQSAGLRNGYQGVFASALRRKAPEQGAGDAEPDRLGEDDEAETVRVEHGVAGENGESDRGS